MKSRTRWVLLFLIMSLVGATASVSFAQQARDVSAPTLLVLGGTGDSRFQSSGTDGRPPTAVFVFDIADKRFVELAVRSPVEGSYTVFKESPSNPSGWKRLWWTKRLTGNVIQYTGGMDARELNRGRYKVEVTTSEPTASGWVRAGLFRPSSAKQSNLAAMDQPSGPASSPALATAQPQSAPPLAQSVIPPLAGAPNGQRVALIIGNSSYGANLGALANPANDADMIGAALRAVGFEVEIVKDADQRTMKRAISRLGERMAAAGPGAIGLFFYAGHGVQTRGTNYLVPVGAAIDREADIDLESVAADTVLRQMEEAGAATNIIILDACRNMPLTRSFRSADRGLARMDAPNGSFVAYSTAPGAVAADGDGRNSPFAMALSEQILLKGQPIEIVFRSVRKKVLALTAGRQTPWDSSSLIEPFIFAP